MSEELYNKLKEEFYRCNHIKYRKYFEEWISNVTIEQMLWWGVHWHIYPFKDEWDESVIGVSVHRL
jgi:hypothetical protein